MKSEPQAGGILRSYVRAKVEATLRKSTIKKRLRTLQCYLHTDDVKQIPELPVLQPRLLERMARDVK